MEEKGSIELSVHSRKWGAISLLANVSQRKKNEAQNIFESKTPKRVQTEFFPSRHEGRRRYKETVHLIISPERAFKVSWNILKVILLMVESVIIPYMLTFSPPSLYYYQFFIQILEIFFLVDIFVTFNTEVYINGVLFSSRAVIAKQYIKSLLLLDLLAVIPYNWFIPQVNLSQPYFYISFSSSECAKFLWLLKLIRLAAVKNQLYSIEDYFVSSIFFSPIRGIKFLFTAFIWTHWLACILYVYFARGLEENSDLWHRYLTSALSMYLRSIYLVIETMTTVGYGDILPLTPNQKSVAIVTMCFACVLFGNIIGNIQGFIENYNANEKYYESHARKLKAHLRQHQLPAQLKHRVIQYIYYLQRITLKILTFLTICPDHCAKKFSHKHADICWPKVQFFAVITEVSSNTSAIR
jgi:hypothetical protein